MKNRVKEVYLMLGHVLNNPTAFQLGERMPRPLEDALSHMQHELFEELREEAADRDTLANELSQDADNYVFPAITVTSFALHGE
jgi:hypothetical protein